MTQLDGADYKSSIQQASNLDMTWHEIILTIFPTENFDFYVLTAEVI